MKLTEQQERGRQRLLEWITVVRQELDKPLPEDSCCIDDVKRAEIENTYAVVRKCTDDELVYFLSYFTSHSISSGILAPGPGPFPQVVLPRPQLGLVPEDK